MKICFITGGLDKSEEASFKLQREYGQYSLADADVAVILGGDGLVLRSIHKLLIIGRPIPIYGMNMGHVGFLANEFNYDNLIAKIRNAVEVNICTLKLFIKEINGTIHESFAVNELYLLRETHQAAKIRIIVNGVERMESLISDGVILSTPVGSTAYNYSAYGPILPISSRMLVMTPISPFRPVRWSGAVLENESNVRFEILENKKRPVTAVADYIEFQNISSVDVTYDKTKSIKLLFDPHLTLNEKLIKLQFT